jgi:hypothetical protein
MIDYSNATIGITGSVLDGTGRFILAGPIAAPTFDAGWLESLTPRQFTPNPEHPEWVVDFTIAEGTTISVADTGAVYRWNGEQWLETPASQVAPGAGPGVSPEMTLALMVGGAFLLSWVLLTPALFS